MRILFIANPHMNLYREIQAEMERQGHTVTCIEDNISSWDPSIHKNIPIPHSIKERIWKRDLTKKWKRIVRDSADFKDGFDVVLVLSGVSVCRELMCLLEEKNPRIKKVLYTWDPCNSYPFDRLLPLFDKAYTFDYQDAEDNKHWRLLPIYYTEESSSEKKYDIFSVGSNRVGRYSFIKKILPQLKENGLNYYVKIIAPIRKPSIKGRILSFLIPEKGKTQEEIETRDFYQGKVDTDILLRNVLGREEYDALSSASKVILDDQKEGQYGLTARFMWAIGNHKKVITTNDKVYNYWFVNQDVVSVIDKETPVLPIDFIKSETNVISWPDITLFRLDNWVKTLLSE